MERALGRSSESAKGFGTTIRRASLIAGAALGGGLVLAARAGFNELAEAQKVAAQTGAVLESTGAAANVTAKHVDELATSLSRMSGVDDEAIASSENLLLTFTNIRNEVGKGNDIFDQATKAVLDMSVALGTDTRSSAIRLGKALQDPIKGMTALRRVGVNFTDAQKEQVKALVDSGKSMEAQKLILRELNTEFGGSAKAAGETLPGQLNKARNAFDEMAANVTIMLIPALTTLATTTARVSEFFQEHKTAAKALFIGLTALAGVLLTVGVATKAFAAAQAVWAAGTAAVTAAQWALNAALTANPIGLVVVALGALVGGLILAYKHSETFRKIVDGAFKLVKAAAEAVLNFFRSNWKIIATLISGPFLPIVALATDAFGIRSKLIAAATTIIDFFRTHWKTIAVLISGPFAPLVALATNAFGIRSALVGAFQSIVEGVREKVGALVGLIAGLPRRIKSALGDLSDLLYNAGVEIIQGLINGITDKLGELYGLVSGVAGKIGSLKGPIEKDRKLLVPQGRAIIEGLIAGMQDRIPDLEKLTSGIAPKITSQLPPGEKLATQVLGAGRLVGNAVDTGETRTIETWAAGFEKVGASVSDMTARVTDGFDQISRRNDVLADSIKDFTTQASDSTKRWADMSVASAGRVKSAFTDLSALAGAGPQRFMFAGAPAQAATTAVAPSAVGGTAEIHTHISLDGTQIAEVVRREYLRFANRNGRAAI